jgi:ComF family protein
MKLLNVFQNFLTLIFPPLCIGCSRLLLANETCLCDECLDQLPKTNYHLHPDNRAADRLAGKVPIERASAYLYYNKGGMGQKLVAALKYKSQVRCGTWIATMMATEMQDAGFFRGIDVIVPVPLHRSKGRKRGFNQAEVLTAAISEVVHIPQDTFNLYRKRANVSQTTKSAFDRWSNTIGLFEVHDPQVFKNKHVLLVDDVLTTGSTLEACVRTLMGCEQVKVSILSLSIA